MLTGVTPAALSVRSTICLKREIEPVDQVDRHPTTLKPYNRKVDVQIRAEIQGHMWEWSDLNDLTPNPHTTRRRPQGPKSIATLNYARLRISSNTSRTKIDLQKFAGIHVGEEQARHKA